MAVTLGTRPKSLSAKSVSILPVASPHETTPQFERFGEWGDRVSVVRDGGLSQMAAKLATHPGRRHLSSDQLWQTCCQENQQLLTEYQIVKLDAPSFFLPAGESVFKVVENPIQLPDNPPQGVIMRHLEAMTAHPFARFYLLEPVFTVDPQLRLLTAEELREESAGDRADSERLAQYLGWGFRTAHWSRARLRDLSTLALRTAVWAVELLIWERVPRQQARFVSLDRSRMTGLLATETLEQLANRASDRGLELEARRLRHAIEILRLRPSIDPVLCFELPDQPGQLWFESHWFTGGDGRRYVHY